MVAQCPSCQSKFRIADEKVTERGVRVRCSSCKNVFQVRRPGSAEAGDEPPPDLAGTTLDLQGYETGRIPTGKVKAPAGAQPRKPSTGPLAGPGAKLDTPADRRLDADDLFGMDELIGEASAKPGSPLATPAPPARRSAPRSAPAPIRPAAPAKEPAAESFDDLDLEADAPPAGPQVPERRARAGRPGGATAPPAAPPEPSEAPSAAAGMRKDASGDLVLDRPAAEPALELSSPAPAPGASTANERRAEPPPEGRADPRQPSAPPPRPRARPRPAPAADAAAARTTSGEIASSALTGVVAAAAALAALLVAGATGFGGHGLRRAAFGGDDVVATHLSSGFYETASGNPVYFVRGQLENHGTDKRGPFRVIAEVVGEGGVAEARAEVSPGNVPSPEDVHGLRSAAEIEKLARSLALGEGQRALPPGGTVPFFALLAEPPRDLQGHTLRVRVETAEAGPPAPRTALKPPR